MKHPALSFLAAVVAVGLASAAQADDKKLTPAAEAGRQEFNTYCVPCHGESAKGDGVAAAALKDKPADLTMIAARNGGRWDATAVAETIDGRRDMPAHGSREMPIWGKFLGQDAQDETDQESLIQGRVALLVAYLETIQVEAPAAPREGSGK